MHIEITTPDQTVYDGEGQLVQLPGIDGSFELLKGHAPLISILKAGKIKSRDNDNHDLFFEIKGGVVEVNHGKVLILSE